MENKAFDSLIEGFASLPGVGDKTAEKMAYHLLRNKDTSLNLADALHSVATKIKPCPECFNFAEDDVCPICAESSRDGTVVCVVNSPKELAAIERTASFRGVYHVLSNELLSNESTLPALLKRIAGNSDIKEIILATNPDEDGDYLARSVLNSLRDLDVDVTQLARGLSDGSSIEFVSSETLAGAIKRRCQWRN